MERNRISRWYQQRTPSCYLCGSQYYQPQHASLAVGEAQPVIACAACGARIRTRTQAPRFCFGAGI